MRSVRTCSTIGCEAQRTWRARSAADLRLLPLATGALAWCPLYVPSGLSTVTRVVQHLSTEALRDVIFVHAQSTVRPRTLPVRSSSSA